MLEHISGRYTIKQIFEDHWEDFQKEHSGKIRQNILDEVAKVLRCKDPVHSGYHRYECVQCGHSIMVPHTCKSRFCSSCGKVATDNWIERACTAFLDVPYHHLVFTIPKQLRNLFAWDRNILRYLFVAAEKTVLEWTKESGGYVPGVVCVLHTFGSDLTFNGHIHMLLTEGGLSPDRTKWISNEYIPWKMLKGRWKYWVVTLLKPELKRLIQEQKIGKEYLHLGTGPRFLRFLGFSVEDSVVVRLDGAGAFECSVHHFLHRTVYQTTSHCRESNQRV